MCAPVLIFILSALIAVPSEDVVANELVNSQEALLTELMRLQSNVTSVNFSLEESVEFLRNVFFKRVRCGSQSGIEPKVCEECLSPRRILSIGSRNDSSLPNRTNRERHVTSIEDLSRFTVIFLNYLLTFQTSCTTESIRQGYVGSCHVYHECWSEINHFVSSTTDKNSIDSIENIEKILREIKVVYEPDPTKDCFSAEKVLNELDTRAEKFKTLPGDIATVLLITSHLFSGECIDVGESVADFLDDIFLHYGDRCERIITQSGFKKLWNDLQTQRRGKHIDHGVQKNSCEYPSSKSQIFAESEGRISSSRTTAKTNILDMNITTAVNNSSTKNTEYNVPIALQSHTNSISNNFSLPESGTTATYNITGVTREENADKTTAASSFNGETSDSISETSYRIMKTSQDTSVHNSKMENTEPGENIEVEIVAADPNTTSSKRIVRHTQISEDHEHKNLANECLPSDDLLKRFLTPGNKVITSLEFLQLCPALVQQAVSGVCNTRLMKGTISADSSEVSIKNGTGDLYEGSKKANPWNAVAAVTIITGASLLGLFLLPLLKKKIFLFVNAFFTGLAFGTMSGDVALHLVPQYLGLHKHDDDHGHSEEEETFWERYFPIHLQRQLVFLLTIYVLLIIESLFSTLSGEKQEHHGHSHGPIEIPMKDLDASVDVENAERKKSYDCTRIIRFLRPSNLIKGITSKVIVILLADTVHNFADGMAIAVGYSLSNKDGFSTTIAVFFHELPHEIGDFALLMNCGLSYWQAFFFNIVSGFTAFLGLGIGVFTASAFREWLLCITAGLFLFVVMGEMLPDMRLHSKGRWKEFIVKIIGAIVGMFAMICIAVYEQIGWI